MGRVFVLPGCMGSQLKLTTEVTPIWVDKDKLRAGGLSKLKLDGKLPGTESPGQLQATAGRGLKEYYQRGTEILTRDLADTDWSFPIEWGYDWRLPLNVVAAQLKAAIEEQFALSGPTILIGHSQGGLIARLAYHTLNLAGKADRVYRIITLGTPHFGTCRVPVAWNGVGEEGILFALNEISKSPLLGVFPGPQGVIRDLTAITMTWPAFYDLMPRIRNDGTVRDAVIAELYTLGYWWKIDWATKFPWLQELSDNASTRTHVFLSDSESVPVGRKLVCVVGNGYPTWDVTKDVVVKRTQLSHFVQTDKGDGTTTMESGYIPGSEKIVVECPHDRLYLSCAESGILKFLVGENFAGTVMTPVKEQRIVLPPANDLLAPMPVVTPDPPPRTGGTPRKR